MIYKNKKWFITIYASSFCVVIIIINKPVTHVIKLLNMYRYTLKLNVVAF